jgi:hypothetical protein
MSDSENRNKIMTGLVMIACLSYAVYKAKIGSDVPNFMVMVFLLLAIQFYKDKN